jgi:hypothetical protein
MKHLELLCKSKYSQDREELINLLQSGNRLAVASRACKALYGVEDLLALDALTDLVLSLLSYRTISAPINFCDPKLFLELWPDVHMFSLRDKLLRTTLAPAAPLLASIVGMPRADVDDEWYCRCIGTKAALAVGIIGSPLAIPYLQAAARGGPYESEQQISCFLALHSLGAWGQDETRQKIERLRPEPIRGISGDSLYDSQGRLISVWIHETDMWSYPVYDRLLAALPLSKVEPPGPYEIDERKLAEAIERLRGLLS